MKVDEIVGDVEDKEVAKIDEATASETKENKEKTDDTKHEIEIPSQLTEPFLQYAAETEFSVEEIVAAALKNYLERSHDNA